MKKALYILLALLIVAIAAALLLVFREPIMDALPIDQSGWSQQDGKTYYLNEKGDPSTGWQDIDGKRYYLGTDGVLVTGWADADGSRYYLDETGAMVTGWLEYDGRTFYLCSDGTLASGWVQIGGYSHYFSDEGTPGTGWLQEDEKRYYLLSDGKAASGWQEIEGTLYFLNSDGTPFQGWLTTSDGGTVYIGDNSAVATGWVDTDEGRFCFDNSGAPLSGWQTDGDSRYYLDEAGKACSGWLEDGGQRYYLGGSGAAVTGWLELDAQRYYFDETGAAVTGWLEKDGQKYYLTENGVVRGKYTINEQAYFFTSTGANLVLVNPWHSLPEDFSVDLVETPGGLVDPVCKDALEKMLDDCRAAGFYPRIVSSYRSIADQRANLANMVASMGGDYNAATKIVAVPGTSEHHLGLALDIVDSNYPKLNHQQATMPAQKWLMEHCWEYGFILRYPENTTDITGIIWEPWHYRYVGTELSLEIRDLGGITLEEYMDRLTNDGTTCGGKLVTE